MPNAIPCIIVVSTAESVTPMRPAVHAGAHSPLSPHPSAWYPYRFWIVSFAFAGMIESLTFVSAVTIVGAATRATGTTAGRSAGAIESASVVVESASIVSGFRAARRGRFE